MYISRFASVVSAIGGASAFYLLAFIFGANWLAHHVIGDGLATAFGLLLFASILFGWIGSAAIIWIKTLWVAGAFAVAFVLVSSFIAIQTGMTTQVFISPAFVQMVLLLIIPLGGAFSALLMRFPETYRR